MTSPEVNGFGGSDSESGPPSAVLSQPEQDLHVGEEHRDEVLGRIHHHNSDGYDDIRRTVAK